MGFDDLARQFQSQAVFGADGLWWSVPFAEALSLLLAAECYRRLYRTRIARLPAGEEK